MTLQNSHTVTLLAFPQLPRPHSATSVPSNPPQTANPTKFGDTLLKLPPCLCVGVYPSGAMRIPPAPLNSL